MKTITLHTLEQGGEKPEREIVPTTNFNKIERWVRHTCRRRSLTLLIGQNGYGKTGALKYLANSFDDILYFKVDMGEPAKAFYARLLHKLVEDENIRLEKLRKSYIHRLLERSSYIINERSDISLIIIDEFGNFNRRFLPYIRQLWDNCHHSTGILLAGPPSIGRDLKKWRKKKVPGINELVSRTGTHKTKLKKPNYNDVRMICHSRGVNDKDRISYLYRKAPDLRILHDMIDGLDDGSLTLNLSEN